MTDNQLRSYSRVANAWRGSKAHYRANCRNEASTLASLYRDGVLVRQCWHGIDGKPAAKYEYRPNDDLIVRLNAGAGAFL